MAGRTAGVSYGIGPFKTEKAILRNLKSKDNGGGDDEVVRRALNQAFFRTPSPTAKQRSKMPRTKREAFERLRAIPGGKDGLIEHLSRKITSEPPSTRDRDSVKPSEISLKERPATVAIGQRTDIDGARHAVLSNELNDKKVRVSQRGPNGRESFVIDCFSITGNLEEDAFSVVVTSNKQSFTNSDGPILLEVIE